MQTDELFGADTPMGGDLTAGLATLALNQEITFKLYGRVVLPIDGYVFWVAAPLLSRPPLASLVTADQLSAVEMTEKDGARLVAKGSLHYAGDVRQEEGEVYTANRVVFTSEKPINNLNAIAPGTMWIGEFGGMRFGFSTLSSRYRQANLWHYSGFAIYSDIEPNIVDRVEQFSDAQVVSNSLPAWLGLAGYKPSWAYWAPPPIMFPSFLAPANEVPPFATVHVMPEATAALAAAPTIDRRTQSHQQLATDTVRITLWGLRNDAAMDFVDAVYQYSANTGLIGIMNVPVVRDEKRTQSELRIIGLKKSVDFQVSYLQKRLRDSALQQIKTAVPTFILSSST